MKKTEIARIPGKGLITAGTIVLFVGLSIVLFREFAIPRYWVTVSVGAALIVAGIVASRTRILNAKE